MRTQKKPEPWSGGKLRVIRDGITKRRIGYAIEDKDGVIWSGRAVQNEVRRLKKL